MSTRIFRKPYGTGAYRVSVQVSFTDAASAKRFAKALDAIKSQAACEGLSFSRRLLALVTRRAGRTPEGGRE